jgi:hypothetical protein
MHDLPGEPVRPRHAARGVLAAALLAAACIAHGIGCSTEESLRVGDQDCVAGGCYDNDGGTVDTTSSSSSGGMACAVDAGCGVSFQTDIYGGILEGPSGCTGTMGCHGGDPPPSGPVLAQGHAHDAYVALTGYTLDDKPGPVKPYIVPCDAAASGFLCNMTLENGAENPFGKCGALMPLALGGQAKITATQLDQIAEWIACGAPEN